MVLNPLRKKKGKVFLTGFYLVKHTVRSPLNGKLFFAGIPKDNNLRFDPQSRNVRKILKTNLNAFLVTAIQDRAAHSC